MAFTMRLAPVYLFREFINTKLDETATPLEKKILDCGAGGVQPPLALFYESGYETHGIDLSEEQIKCAEAFGREHKMELNIRLGDVRDIPFADETFSFVYEFYSICHLNKRDTGIAIREMLRVLKRGGYGFLGFMSADTWPLEGRDVGKGEYQQLEDGELVLHSAYTDAEADPYFAAVDIVLKEKRTFWYRDVMARLPKEEWEAVWQEDWTNYSKETWGSMYEERLARGCYAHLYYTVRKPQ